MKYIPLALLTLTAIGCGRNEFDVSAAQVNEHKRAAKPAETDTVRLPLEAFKTGIKVKKGDRLPDGTTAQQDGRMVARPDGKGDGR